MSQNWLTLATAYFDHHVVRDRGINAMGHNLGDDDIDWSDPARPALAGVPLRLFHFAGRFTPRDPLRFSTRACPGGPTRRNARVWRGCAAATRICCSPQAGRKRAAGGSLDVAGPVAIDAAMRHAYRDALLAAERDEAPSRRRR